MKTTFIIAQAAEQGGGMSSLLMLGGMFLILYFFMIRPQMKKAKEAKKFREALNQGDQVVTIGGIHGKILEIGDTNVLLSVDSGKIRVEKSAISPGSVVNEQALSGK